MDDIRQIGFIPLVSQLLVQNYLNEIDRLRKFSGLSNEFVLGRSFEKLLDSWATSRKLVFLAEYLHQTVEKTTAPGAGEGGRCGGARDLPPRGGDGRQPRGGNEGRDRSGPTAAETSGEAVGTAPPSALPGAGASRASRPSFVPPRGGDQPAAARVTRVSVETVAITEAMREARR